MSDVTAGRLRSWGGVNVVLAAVLALMLAALVAVGVGGNKVLPWTTPAKAQVDTDTQVQDAARGAMQAFLDVDYRHMSDDMAAVRAASTGAFAKQYAHSAVELKAAAEQAHSVSQGTIARIGVNSVDGDTATALVVANVVVKNATTASRKATASCPHDGAQCDVYRFAVTLTRTDSGWKMSNLVGVS
jgi:hypothetical protein